MNKGKETYTNISIPDGLSSAVEDGIRRGKRQLEKKWFTAFGTLAAACVLGVVLFRVVSDNSVRTPLENGPATARMSSEPEGGSPDDQAPAGAQTMMVSGNDIAASDAANETETSASESQTASSDAQNDVAADPAMEAPSSIRVYGTVTEIQDGQILLENDVEGDPYASILLNVTEDTIILSASDYSEKELSDIQQGETLYAYVSPAMTRSLPPMSNALLIFCEIEDELAVPTYATITDISVDEDGTTRISTDQQLILIPGDNTSILTLDGEAQLSVSDLAVGDQILASYQIMTMSIPAQTSPDEIRLMP